MSKYRVETPIPESQPEVDVKEILFAYVIVFLSSSFSWNSNMRMVYVHVLVKDHSAKSMLLTIE